MKKVLFAAVVISIGFAGCQKEEVAQPEKIKIEKKVLDGEDDGGGKREEAGNGWG